MQENPSLKESNPTLSCPPPHRPQLDLDIACVGFGPAMAGFLTTLSRRCLNADGSAAFESPLLPGSPLQIACYERADDIGFGVSGAVTIARGIRSSFPELDPSHIPLATCVTAEKVVYLMDPIGASRRSLPLQLADNCLRTFQRLLAVQHEGIELPWTPTFLHKKDGIILALGQFMQWVGAQIQNSGQVQIWPGTPVARVLIENDQAVGIRLLDQGVDALGQPAENFQPGMDVRAALTVVGDGPTGPIGRQLDEQFGLPEGHHQRDWALGMKFVVDLPPDTPLQTGFVLHTFGYPEPEMFGFFYVHPERVASLGLFVPSWFENPVRTAYRYVQHWMLHPYLWRYLKKGRLRSWGAKTIGESGSRGQPHLVGNGFARIGEGSGSTNVLTGSGIDEAWTTGVQLGEAVCELLAAKLPFTKRNLEGVYVGRRRASWVETQGRIAKKSRDGFQHGLLAGLCGMLIAHLTRGKASLFGEPSPPHNRLPSIEEYFQNVIPSPELKALRAQCARDGVPLHNALMDRAGWPPIPYDGQILVSHQDALLRGGKVQAPPGFAHHVAFVQPEFCRSCKTQVCIELCSGEAIHPGPDGYPTFDRDKCVHCGACAWNCSQAHPKNPERTNIAFNAGAGGLHSAEN